MICIFFYWKYHKQNHNDAPPQTGPSNPIAPEQPYIPQEPTSTIPPIPPSTHGGTASAIPTNPSVVPEDPENPNVSIALPEGPQLTEFMEYVEKNQLEGFPVYKVMERFDHESSTNISVEVRPAFLFTVFHKDGLYLLIYESTWKKRATLLFSVKEEMIEAGTKAILRYFSSDKVNKREKLSRHMRYLKRSGIVKYTTKQHTDYEGWKHRVRFSPEAMIRDAFK